MSRAIQHEDSDRAVYPYPKWNSAIDGYDRGVIETKHCLVSVYAQGDDENFYHTMIELIRDGRVYRRSWRSKRYSRTYMVTLAKRFADELFMEAGK